MKGLGIFTALLCLGGASLFAGDIVDVVDENGVVIEGAGGAHSDGGLISGQSLKVENFLEMFPHEPSGPLDIEY